MKVYISLNMSLSFDPWVDNGASTDFFNDVKREN